jgi:drug/metabolite transporter (DMT)-like permease
VLASVSYAAGNLYAGERMSAGGPVLAATSMLAAFVVLLPFALTSLPSQAPGWEAVGSGIVLGIAGTAVAQILSYRMIGIYGSSRSVLVAYMLPGFALLYGSLFLSESLAWQKLFGLVMILGGVGLGSGAVKLPRRTPMVQSP